MSEAKNVKTVSHYVTRECGCKTTVTLTGTSRERSAKLKELAASVCSKHAFASLAAAHKSSRSSREG